MMKRVLIQSYLCEGVYEICVNSNSPAFTAQILMSTNMKTNVVDKN
jgi:hypothetical protein